MGEEGAAATAAGPRRVLLAGDARGNVAKLYTQVANQAKRVGTFDAVFAAGAFLPAAGGDPEAAAGFAKYVSGKEKVPAPTYFIEGRSAAVLQAAPQGKQFADGLNFLGAYGVKEVCGLRVAFLSGHYDRAVYDAPGADQGPAFVGAAFTPKAIAELVQQVEEACGADKRPVDVLLTADWPARLEEKLDEAEKPRHPDDQPIKWAEVTAPPIAELCVKIEPRYHVFGTADIFYQRPPFQTPTQGHVCRCIGLGCIGSKGKGRLWIHALALTPAAAMPDIVLKQRPDNTTPCPFAQQTAASEDAVGTGTKRSHGEMLGDGGGGAAPGAEEAALIPNEVFIARLPANIDEKRLYKVLQNCGTIERLSIARDNSADGKPCKGFGFVTFATPEEAQAACELNEMLECGGRKLSISLAKERSKQDGGPRKKQAQIVIEPHSECWFCLVNPKVEKHMIVTATTDVYVAMARGGLGASHVLVLPVKHAPCFASCPADLQQVLQAHVAAVRKLAAADGQDCIVWERWLPFGTSAANHMQLQVLPIDRQYSRDAAEALEAAAKRHLPGASFKRVSSHAEVIDHLGDDASTPYVYFELPGDNTAKGRLIERYVYAGGGGGPRIPLNFGRQVACQLLGCEDKVDWRQCQEDRDSEKLSAIAFRERFKAYLPPRQRK
eukprot:TRINITY_DN21312_c0_g1_i1.p1 TRINITY_DN21312_c0_g1~~TRINITY_DN21312_c0_g1_i1.p1  ORF type:complete len:665 (-),score=160.20 TRINITY_DN21312_c0_g1_i1:383-2377(-)